MAESPPTPPWMILDRRTQVLPPNKEHGQVEPGMKISYRTPPLRTVLLARVAHRMYIAAVEPTGYFLLCSSAEDGAADQVLYICDATKATVTSLTLAAQRSSSTAQNVGVGVSVGDAERSMGRDLGVEAAPYGERSIAERLEELGVVAHRLIADGIIADRLRNLGVFADRVISERLDDLGVFTDHIIADRLQILGIEADHEDDRPRVHNLGVKAEHLEVGAARDGERVIAEHLIVDDTPRVQNIGVIAGRNGKFIIVELRQARVGEHIHARLLCFSPVSTDVNKDKWVEKEVAYPPHLRPWRGDGAISHQNRICWFSLGYGLLICDPFDDKPILNYFPLPSGCELTVEELNQNKDLSRHRCVNTSADNLWFVILEGAGKKMVITQWCFVDESWSSGYELPLLEMWNDKTYRALGLQRAAPEIIFVHPIVPELIYLLEGSQLFSVDLRTTKVVPCIKLSDHEQHLSQTLLMPWQLKWRPWVMLASAAKCVPGLGDNVVLARMESPHPSQLLFGPACLEKNPEYLYVAATDPSGLILLCAGYRRQGRSVVRKVYFVKDQKAPDHRLSRLPDQSEESLIHGSVGIIADPRNGGSIVVAELVPGANGHGMIRFWTSLNPHRWSIREVNYPLSSASDGPWNGNGVLVWNEMLWWIDLSQGLVSYNIFAEKSKVRYLPFPADTEMDAQAKPPSSVEIGHRVVNMSEGCLRYAEMHGPENAPVVRVWTVVTNQRKKLNWRHEYDLNMKEVWSSSWFKSTCLPCQMPALALVHPLHHKLLYFLQDGKIFSVDVSSPSVDMQMTVKFEVEGSAGECRSGRVQPFFMPIESLGLVPNK